MEAPETTLGHALLAALLCTRLVTVGRLDGSVSVVLSCALFRTTGWVQTEDHRYSA